MLLMRPCARAKCWITPCKHEEEYLLPIEESIFPSLKRSAPPASPHLHGHSRGRERRQAEGVCLLGEEAQAWQQGAGCAFWIRRKFFPCKESLQTHGPM